MKEMNRICVNRRSGYGMESDGESDVSDGACPSV